MPYYTFEQNELIKNLLNEAIQAETDEGTRKILQDTLVASDLDHQTESCREDVLSEYEELKDSIYIKSGKVLTDKQIDHITHLAINYDQSQYNQFICDTIIEQLQS